MNYKEATMPANPDCYHTHPHLLLAMNEELQRFNRLLSHMVGEEEQDATSESKVWEQVG
jgi:hypothetical protein